MAEKEELRLPEEVDEALCCIGGLDVLKEAIPDIGTLEKEAEMHNVLSDKYRLQIMHALICCELCPCVLKEITGLSDSKLSYHLSKLEEMELVRSRQNKNWRVFGLTEMGRAQTVRMMASFRKTNQQ